MMRVSGLFSMAVFALTLSGCDAVRFPGDGRPLPDDRKANAPLTSPLLGPETAEASPEEGDPSPADDQPESPAPEADQESDPDPSPNMDAEEDTSPPSTEMPGADSDPPLTSPDTSPEPASDDTSEPAQPESDTEPTPSDPALETSSETEDTATVDSDEVPAPAPDPAPLPIKFQYYPPGTLAPGSGAGLSDTTIYVPEMVFPIKQDPAFPGSQVWGYGGGMSTGGQCDARNYTDVVWQDNFCEYRSRARNTPLCPSNNAHQGQDIRVGSRQGCLEMVDGRPDKPTLYEVVATEGGIIQYIGSYSLTLKGTDTGNLYNYLHLNMGALQVAENDIVSPGQLLGYISDDFGGTPTTYHLHFEIKGPVEGIGFSHLPPYTSLIAAYERRENGRGERVEPDTVAVASTPTVPEGLFIGE